MPEPTEVVVPTREGLLKALNSAEERLRKSHSLSDDLTKECRQLREAVASIDADKEKQNELEAKLKAAENELETYRNFVDLLPDALRFLMKVPDVEVRSVLESALDNIRLTRGMDGKLEKPPALAIELTRRLRA